MSEVQRNRVTAVEFASELLDVVTDVVYVVDEDDRLVVLNEPGRDCLGYDDEDVPGLRLPDLLAPEDKALLDGDGRAMVDLPDRTREVDLVAGDGEHITHELRGVTLSDPETGDRYRVGVARDISDRLASEQELERYETIVETVGDGVYALDDDLTFSFVNEGLCDLLGRSRAELVGTDPRDLFHDDDQVAVADTLRRQVTETGTETMTLEAVTETPAGERRELESNYRLLGSAEDGTFPGSAGVIRDVTERNRTQRKLARQRALLQGILNTIPDVVFAFDEDFQALAPEFLLEGFAGYTADEMAEMSPLEVIPPEDRDAIVTLLTDVLENGATASMESELITANGDRVPYEFRGTRLEDEDGEVLGIVGTGRDIASRVERERALEQRRDELATLNRITELLLDVTRDLVEADSRLALEETICERLADSPLYRFAWIGERELDGDRVHSRASAGADEGYFEDLPVSETEAPGQAPVADALRTGEVQVINVDDPDFEPGGVAATAHDVASIAGVPLSHDDTVYGVLAVYATRPDAFSEREQAGFRVLGETVGFVVNAVKRRKLLFADSVAQLEFVVDDAEAMLPRLATSLDCDIALVGYADAGSQWIVYLDVEGADPSALADELAGESPVDRSRVIADQRERRRVEVTLSGLDLLDAVASVGGTVAEATAEPGEGRIVLEIPADADVRETVNLLTERLPTASLVAQRDRDRRPERPAGSDGPLSALTARQREVLTVAYRAGYYQWPRESTAEEVAATLDIAPATLHAHLRKAERTLFASLLDGV